MSKHYDVFPQSVVSDSLDSLSRVHIKNLGHRPLIKEEWKGFFPFTKEEIIYRCALCGQEVYRKEPSDDW